MQGIGSLQAPLLLSTGGLLIGMAFGAILMRTDYCTMGALADVHYLRDYRRLRACILAAATAMLGAQLLELTGIVALDKSPYLTPRLHGFAVLAGGATFGIGMVFAGGCPARNLSRAGGGDLRALFVVGLVGLFAHMMIGGVLAPLRVALDGLASLSTHSETQRLGDVVGQLTGLPRLAVQRALALLLAAGALTYCFGDARFRRSRAHIASGIGVGLTVVAGWALTGIAYDELAVDPMPPTSLSYVRPAGDTLQWLMLASATPLPGFAVASVVGALIGAFAVAMATGRFRIATFADANDTARSLLGAFLMGTGGVLALGCTIGQAITGVSTLAVGSFLAAAAIACGGRLGLTLLERLAGSAS
jgi:uncharacterized membrane protein YedE/YeeE